MPTALRRSLLLPLLLLLLAGCEQPPLLDRLQRQGELHIATVRGPLTCTLDEKGPAGLEYELAGAFARSLSLEPVFHVYPTRARALEALARGRVQMVAAARQPTAADRTRFRLSRPWHAEPLVFARTMGLSPVRLQGEPPPEPVSVAARSLAEARLTAAAPALAREPVEEISEEALLDQLDGGVRSRTLVNRLLLEIRRGFRPRLVRGAELPPPEGFRWYFAAQHDDSLQRAADRFLTSPRARALVEAFLKAADAAPRRDFVTLRDFWKHLEKRLPKYEALFRKAAEETGIDWRLLAAIGYQESHWRPDAVSPTGVRGIMMLTRDAARHEGVTDRTDPAQSIAGGARYLRWMERRIPERIREPDRLWLTLAGYNIGYGHLEDARVLTQRGGGDPDRWEEVKRFLPLLSKRKYYRTVKHGKARGGEPVAYVENIRYYYRLLVWWDNGRRGLDCTSNDYPRLALKKLRSSEAQASASTPPSTAVR